MQPAHRLVLAGTTIRIQLELVDLDRRFARDGCRLEELYALIGRSLWRLLSRCGHHVVGRDFDGWRCHPFATGLGLGML